MLPILSIPTVKNLKKKQKKFFYAYGDNLDAFFLNFVLINSQIHQTYLRVQHFYSKVKPSS
jgi:hypothetical protein